MLRIDEDAPLDRFGPRKKHLIFHLIDPSDIASAAAVPVSPACVNLSRRQEFFLLRTRHEAGFKIHHTDLIYFL
jgi:hypothetical protein